MIEFIKTYWYYPIIILIFVTGIILTVRLKGLQFRKLGKAIKLMFNSGKEGHGEVSSFAALCISLSATIGTGNIVGVATAVFIGGPGALFWMIIVSLIGLATKYAEGYLAIRYRKINLDGYVVGGPFAYIEYGMGKKFLPLAKIFAMFGAIAALAGIGTMTQSNGITESFNDVISEIKNNQLQTISIFGHEVTLVTIIVGISITVISTLVLVGGIKRISKVCELIVPFMAVIYIVSCLLILILNITSIPKALVDIVVMAFNGKSASGGLIGYTITKSLTSGVQKGIFANEAGLGSTPIALSTAQSNDPVKEGLISMGAMAVTIVICLMTGLVVVCTSSYNIGLEGIHITNNAFQTGLCFNQTFSSILLLLCITFFAFTTIIGWNLYGMKCINYLSGNKKVVGKIYLVLYLIMILIGSFLKINLVWQIADIFNSLMAIPNLIALIYLSKTVAKDTCLDIYEAK